jgi:ATP-dependent RNA helicase DDX42
MGIFDESSSDDDSNAPHTTLQQQNLHDEEDPLDAYMKSIAQDKEVVPANSLRTTEPSEKASTFSSRFDPENDDSDEHEYLSIELDSADKEEEDNDETISAQRSSAKQALESTFRKASSSRCTDSNEHVSTHDTSSERIPVVSAIMATNHFESKFWDGENTILGNDWRRDHDVTLRRISNHNKRAGIGVENSTANINLTTNFVEMDPILNFQQLSTVFGESLLQEIFAQKYTTPTLVQAQTLPIAMSGLDCLITASTGQGKTLAYIWPICVHLKNQPLLQPTETGPLALVLVPTRELALQVQKQAKPMLNAVQVGGRPLRCRAVIGGQGKYMLTQELKKTGGIELVIATPGRLLDVVSDTKGLSLKRITILVLDEADKMLHMGFEQQVNQLLQQIRPDRQTMMLSATMGSRIEKVAAEWLNANRAIRICVGRTGEVSENVDQHIMVLPSESAKESFLIEMLPILKEIGRIIVFVSTRIKCEHLAELVRSRASNLPVVTLHGDKHQTDRTTAVRDFSKGKIKVLIATDVAARGLDIPNVQTVLSFDPAKDLDSHVHRLGRAGRLSKETNRNSSGSAYTLLTKSNADFAHVLVGSLRRQGKDVTSELELLAGTSRRKNANANPTRTLNDKAGLGFTSSVAANGGALHSGATLPTNTIEIDAPQSKRFRNE